MILGTLISSLFFLQSTAAAKSQIPALIEYLTPSRGNFALSSRTFTDGIIDLSHYSPNGSPFTTTCQDALGGVVQQYYTVCSVPGKQAGGGDSSSTVDNWIQPLCDSQKCGDLSYDSGPRLDAACGRGSKEVYKKDGILTGLNTAFFEEYRFESRRNSSVCRMGSESGVHCAAKVIGAFSQVYQIGSAFAVGVGFCGDQCVYQIQQAICGSCFNDFYGYINAAKNVTDIAPLFAQILNVKSLGQYALFKEMLNIVNEQVCSATF